MKNIKNNTNISDFDDFLCKLEEKEEFGCFIVHCSIVLNEHCTTVSCGVYTKSEQHNTVNEQNGAHEAAVVNGQNGAHEAAVVNEQNGAHEAAVVNGQNGAHEAAVVNEQNGAHEAAVVNEQNGVPPTAAFSCRIVVCGTREGPCPLNFCVDRTCMVYTN